MLNKSSGEDPRLTKLTCRRKRIDSQLDTIRSRALQQSVRVLLKIKAKFPKVRLWQVYLFWGFCYKNPWKNRDQAYFDSRRKCILLIVYTIRSSALLEFWLILSWVLLISASELTLLIPVVRSAQSSLNNTRLQSSFRPSAWCIARNEVASRTRSGFSYWGLLLELL